MNVTVNAAFPAFNYDAYIGSIHEYAAVHASEISTQGSGQVPLPEWLNYADLYPYGYAEAATEEEILAADWRAYQTSVAIQVGISFAEYHTKVQALRQEYMSSEYDMYNSRGSYYFSLGPSDRLTAFSNGRHERWADQSAYAPVVPDRLRHRIEDFARANWDNNLSEVDNLMRALQAFGVGGSWQAQSTSGGTSVDANGVPVVLVNTTRVWVENSWGDPSSFSNSFQGVSWQNQQAPLNSPNSNAAQAQGVRTAVAGERIDTLYFVSGSENAVGQAEDLAAQWAGPSAQQNAEFGGFVGFLNGRMVRSAILKGGQCTSANCSIDIQSALSAVRERYPNFVLVSVWHTHPNYFPNYAFQWSYPDVRGNFRYGADPRFQASVLGVMVNGRARTYVQTPQEAWNLLFNGPRDWRPGGPPEPPPAPRRPWPPPAQH